MRQIKLKQIECPSCGKDKFKQEIVETYFRYLDGKGEVIEYEEDFTHDMSYGIIRCAGCDADCADLFHGIDIE